jgi:hypothetical protein
LYATRPQLLKYLASALLAVSVTGAFGGAALMLIQPEILVGIQQYKNGSKTGEEPRIEWWYPTAATVKAKEFAPLTITGILLSAATFYAALGMFKPKQMMKYLTLVILFAQIAFSLFYSFLGAAFNIISIAAYSLCLIYMCRPKVRAYLEYLHHYSSKIEK